MTSDFHWRKSSFSGNAQQECVEVGFPVAGPLDEVAVRDSKDPEGGHFALSPAGWRGFLAKLTQNASVR
ncbi:DUF397 domain-containing protein [Amycolatopsis sp. DSM 110486]|uniref:DUF397 domain-containing protein n=1 Tax=Amycolatopsis sp. DSM 110486 TaxID=2865832 RepID=UPI001C6A5321|nr:DUF397 domain-containing protein [Amycolatopsis sp. DSM 110486]QYN17367.1 DUF397 domain-containing protein [Amycolatopsis sp. DSM 110486]